MVRLFFYLLLSTLVLRPSTSSAAFRGDGTSARAYGYSSSTNLNLTNDITIALWVVKEVGMANSSEFVNKGRNDDGNLCNYSLRDDAAGGLELYWTSASGTFHGIKSVTKFTRTNVPVHIAVTHQYGTTNNSMFWIDGVRANVQGSLGTPQSNGVITNSGALAILGYAGGQHAKMQVYELCLWGQRLTAEEIRSLANGRLMWQGFNKRPRPEALVGYWTFSEARGGTTITGAPWRDYSGWNTALYATNSPQSRPTFLGVP